MDGGRGELALVTGCTGYIASHVVKAAHEAGYAVRGRCVRGRPGARPRGPHRADSRCRCAPSPTGSVRRAGDAEKLRAALGLPSLEEVVCDLTSEAGWDEAVAGVSVVFHVASPVSLLNVDDEVESVVKPALLGTFNVMRAAARSGCVRRVVITSSMAAYV